MMSKPVMISVSGIRGIVGEGLSPELIMQFAAAAGTFYGKGRVMVGRDSRVTGEMVKHAVFSSLMAVGCDPVDLGICATPTVEMAVQHSDAVGGIIITASHNPCEWNALKLLGSDGMFLDAEQGALIKEMVDAGDFQYVSWDQVGHVEMVENATQDHIDHLLKLSWLDLEAIRTRKFKVAIDCVNGAGGVILPRLLQSLGCEVTGIHVEPHGRFAHTPEPVPENLRDLCSLVKENKADIGLAVDPDVDRLALVSENGAPLGEEYTLALATRFALSKSKGPVVVNMSTSRVIDDIAKDFNVPVERTKVGEIHVARKMQEIDAAVGGEGNGGVLLPELHLGRDALLAVVMILQSLVDFGGTISELWSTFPMYTMTKSKINIGSSNPDQIVHALSTAHSDQAQNHLDGLKIEWEDRWVHVRKYNTEPIIRIISEAPTEEESKSLCNAFISEIEKLMASFSK